MKYLDAFYQIFQDYCEAGSHEGGITEDIFCSTWKTKSCNMHKMQSISDWANIYYWIILLVTELFNKIWY